MSVCPIVRHKSIRLSRMSRTDGLASRFDHARTDEEVLFPKDGAAHARGVMRKVFRFDANPLFDLAIRGGERAELATEFPRVTVQVSGQIVRRRNHKERTASRPTEPRRASLCSQDSVGGVLPYRTLIL